MNPALAHASTRSPRPASRHPVAAPLLLMLAMSAPIASAEQPWPYPDSSGRGHFDQYQRTLICHALLRDHRDNALKDERHNLIEKGINYTLNFAAFLLESGNVVDQAGSILTTADLPARIGFAEAHWKEARSANGVTPHDLEDALSDCLSRFGHDWE